MNNNLFDSICFQRTSHKSQQNPPKMFDNWQMIYYRKLLDTKHIQKVSPNQKDTKLKLFKIKYLIYSS